MSHQHKRFLVWMEQAEYDLMAAKVSFQNKFYEWSSYQCVQSVEKSLKAVLVSARSRPPKIHKLGVLLSMCNAVYPEFINIKLNFRYVESFTFITRYPFIIPSENHKPPHEIISKKDAESLISITEEILTGIKHFLMNLQNLDLYAHSNLINLENEYFTVDEVNAKINSVVNLLISSDILKVKKIILFGSFAKNKIRPKSSTMDILIIVEECKLSFVDRIIYVRNLTKGSFPIVEALVYTEKEFQVMIEDESEGFLESAIEEGVVLWSIDNPIKNNIS